jgi:hypothetical protein
MFIPSATAPVYYVYDIATNAWTQKAVTGMAATNYGTASIQCATPSISGLRIYGKATAGGATTITDTTKAWVTNDLAHCEILITSGTGIGQTRTVISNTATEITVAAWTTNPDVTSTYEITIREQGIATSGGATSITDTAKAWTSDQWKNYQVRITKGLGIGQVRTITTNSATALTVAAWGTNPDNTSVYSIEGNNDTIYMAGDAVVVLNKYSISSNTWSTAGATAARSGNTGAGLSLNWINEVDSSLWRGKGLPASQRQNGRYLYSFRGGANSTLDIYDIAAGTWVSTWGYGNAQETFTTGSSWCDSQGFIYGQKDSTGRFFRFDVLENKLEPLGTNVYPTGTAVAGKKLIVKTLTDQNGNKVQWLYVIHNSLSIMHRILLV